MADKAGPVEIVVDIVGNFKDELEQLEKQLDKLDQKKIDVDFEIDSEGEIKKVQAQLKQLKKDIDSNLDINTRGEAKAQAIKTALSKDMRSTLHINTKGDFPGIPPPLGEDAMDAARGASQGTLNRNIPGYFPKGEALGTGKGLVDTDDLSPEADFMQRIQSGIARSRSARRTKSGVLRMPTGVTDFFRGGIGAPEMPRFQGGLGFDPSQALTGPRGLGRGFDMESFGRQSRRRLRKLAQTFDKLRPNIMMVWNALAALIPIFISLGAAAIGLAGGMIAIATAGAAVLGLGLLGWGDDFQSSLQNVREEAALLGRNLFDVMQPVSRTAQPIMQGWMRGAPDQIQKLVDPLDNLILAFESTLGAAGAGIINWIVDVVNSMTAMEGIISQITLRFGNIAGNFLIDFMENMIMFAYENQDALIRMSGALRNLLGALLNVSIVITRILNALHPVTELLLFLSGIISNRLVASFIAAATATILFQTTLASMTSISAAAGAGILGSLVSSITAYLAQVYAAISATWTWIASLTALKAALALTGIGLVAVGAGALAYGAMGDGPSRRGGGSSGTGGTIININGDVEKRQMDRLLDEVPGETRNELSINQEMNMDG